MKGIRGWPLVIWSLLRRTTVPLLPWRFVGELNVNHVVQETTLGTLRAANKTLADAMVLPLWRQVYNGTWSLFSALYRNPRNDVGFSLDLRGSGAWT